MAAYEEEDDDGYFIVAAAYEEDDDDGFAIAASSEEEDDDYIKVITTFVPPPLPLPLPHWLPSSSSSSHVCAAAIAPPSPAPYVDDAEEQIVVPSSPSPAGYWVDDDIDLHDDDAALRQQDGMAVDDDASPWAAHVAPTPLVVRRCRYRKSGVFERTIDGFWNMDDVVKTMDLGGGGEVTDDDEEEEEEEEEDEDEDDYMYMYLGYYDLADRRRARHVKRSSGRRGRTKKASAMGRPRGDVRVANCSVNL